MHCSIWKWRGAPDDLAARYAALVADVPAQNMVLSAGAKTPDGIVVFDTCPSPEVFAAFSTSEGSTALLGRHGLGPADSLVDGPVVVAFAGGRRVDS